MSTRARAAMRGARVLAVSLDSLGDLVLRQPLFAALHAAGYPTTLLVRAAFAPAARLVAPHANVLEFPLHPYAISEREGRAIAGPWVDSANLQAFDVLLSTQFESTWVDRLLREHMPDARHFRFTVDGNGTGVGIASGPDVDVPVPVSMHEWTKCGHLAAAVLGAVAEWPRPALSVPPEAQARARAALADLGLAAGEFVVCTPAGISNIVEKAVPVELVVAGIEAFHTRYGVRTLVVGLPFEQPHMANVIAAAAARGIEVPYWFGDAAQPDILSGILDSARAYFGGDTGTMHVAAALAKPVLAIFGGGMFPRFTPVADRGCVLTQRLACFGCQWQCWTEEPPCIATVTPERVDRAVDWLMQGGAMRIDEGMPADDPLLTRLVSIGRQSAVRIRARRAHAASAVDEQFAAARAEVETLQRSTDALRNQQDTSGHLIGQLSAELAIANGERHEHQARIRDLERQLVDLRRAVGVISPLDDGSVVSSLPADEARERTIVELRAHIHYLEQLGFKGRLSSLARYAARRARSPARRVALRLGLRLPDRQSGGLSARAKNLVKRGLWRIAAGAAQPPLPSITLVTPVFNGRETIGDTIESVLRQRYPNLQYIVVDGSSTDGTVELVRQYAGRRDFAQRIDRFLSEPDKGMYDAIAKGFAMATGEVLGYINADDLLETDALQRVGAFFARNPNASVVYHEDAVWVQGWKFPNVEQPFHVGPWDLMRRHILFQDGVYFRRGAYEAVGGIRGDLTRAGDFDLWLRLSSRFRFHRGNGHVSTFRVRSGQLSQDMASYGVEVDRSLGDWRRTVSPLLRVTWSCFGAVYRVMRRAWRVVHRRDLFFPIDFANMPPPAGIAPPATIAGRPRSPLDGRPPERVLFSTMDTRFGERLINHVYLDEHNRVAIAYPPIDGATLDELYRKHYSNPPTVTGEVASYTPSPYRGYFGGGRLRRRLLSRPARVLTRAVRVDWNDTTLDEILEVLRPLSLTANKPLRFLDVGCFEGILLDGIKARTAWQCFGLEPNEHAIGAARRKGHHVWRSHAEDALDIVPADAQFDVIFMGQSIEHVDDPLKVLRRLRLLLAGDGVIVLSTPNLDSRQIEWFGPTWAHWHLPYHRHIFSPRSLSRMAAGVGMSLAVCRSFSHPYWTTMTLAQNRLGLAGTVSHAVSFSEELRLLGKHVTALSKLFWDRRLKGDYLFAVFREGDGQ